MTNKPFEQWWAGLEATDKPGCRYVKIDYRKIHMDEAEARELHAQIIEASYTGPDYAIMRRFAQLDDTPLGCYVPVAYCDHYGKFEELIEAAGKPHALICIRTKERPDPEAEPVDDAVPSGKTYESVDAMLKDQGAHDTRARLLKLELEELTKERDKLRTDLERLKQIAADYLTNGVSSGYLNEFRDAIDDYLPKK